jgi:DNA-binding GntR family transcriptional regulator
VALRNEILHLALKPGAKLDEMGLVRKFGISRTPVREALIRLASEGLVFLLPNRGAQVAPLDLVDIAHYFEALELLQCAVNHWAARRRTDEDLEDIRRQRDAFRRAAGRYSQGDMMETNRDLHAAIARAATIRISRRPSSACSIMACGSTGSASITSTPAISTSI